MSLKFTQEKDRDKNQPGIARCACGRTLEFWDSSDVYCDCGRDYNGSGQLLAPREQWGEETGESPADIARWFSGAGPNPLDDDE